MFRIVRNLLAALAIMAASTASTATAQDMSGKWVWNVEGRNILVLNLAYDPGDGLSGSWKQPSHFGMVLSGGSVGVVGATLPVVERLVDTMDVTESGTRLRVTNTETGETGIWLLRPIGERAELSALDAADAPRVVLMRPRPATEVADDLDPARTYSDRPDVDSDPELAALFEADQTARQAERSIDWSVVGPQDAARRERARELIQTGRVNSADDYMRAAFIFQHGGEDEDYLLAHALAVTAVAKGKGEAAWIAAATLDRYLQSVGKPQIYGTQFAIPNNGEPATQGAYDSDLLSDRIREASGVPTLARQQTQLEAYRARQAPR